MCACIAVPGDAVCAKSWLPPPRERWLSEQQTSKALLPKELAISFHFLNDRNTDKTHRAVCEASFYSVYAAGSYLVHKLVKLELQSSNTTQHNFISSTTTPATTHNRNIIHTHKHTHTHTHTHTHSLSLTHTHHDGEPRYLRCCSCRMLLPPG